MAKEEKTTTQNVENHLGEKTEQQVYRQYLDGTQYFNSLGLDNDIKRCIHFFEGRQWNMDDDIEDFPKITINIIRQIFNIQISGILQNEYGYLVNTDKMQNIRKVQDFLKVLAHRLNLREKDLQVLRDDYKKGVGVLYFFWDAEQRGFMSKSMGSLRAEVVDIRRIRVASPHVQEIQDQEWVILSTREKVDSVNAKYNVKVEADADEDHIEKADYETDPKKKLVTVFTKFYRNKDGQVCFTVSTRYELLKGETALNPFYKGNLKEAKNTMTTQDAKKADVKSPLTDEVFNLYPFNPISLNPRDNSFYGIPTALEYLDAQKSINNHFAVYDKAIQDNVLGGFVMRKGITGDEPITTDNGQRIQLDLRPGEKIQDVFGRLPIANVPSDAMGYSNTLMGSVRQVAGATNVQMGQSDYSGQSGKQTELLLQRAKENSSMYAMIFNAYKKRQAEIMFLFAKFFYDNEEFSIVEHGYSSDQVVEYKNDNKFDGQKFVGKDVMFDIKVGPSPAFSEYTNIEMLGMMVQTGKAPLELYILSLPDSSISNKQEMLNILKDNSQKQLEQMAQQLQQAQNAMQLMTKEYQKMSEKMNSVDNVIRENMSLKELLAKLASKSGEVQKQMTEENQVLTKDIQDILKMIQQGRASVGENGAKQ